MGTNHLAMRPSVRLIVTLLAALSIIAAQMAVFTPFALASNTLPVSGPITGGTANECAVLLGVLIDEEILPEGSEIDSFFKWDEGDLEFDGDSASPADGTPDFTDFEYIIGKYGASTYKWFDTSVTGNSISDDEGPGLGLSHVVGCSFTTPPPPATVSLTIDKTQIDNRDPVNDETFTFSIDCTDGTDTTRQITGTGTATVTGIAENATCTVTETVDGGADTTTAGTSPNPDTETDTVSNIDIGTDGTTVYFVNTFDAPPVVANPNIALTKTAVTVDSDSLIPGELVEFEGDKIFLITNEVTGPFEITYTFEIENTGDVTLFDVELSDPMLGGVLTIDQDLSGGFAPGDIATASATYTLTEGDIAAETLPNTATVTGIDEEQTEVSDTADKTIEILEIAGIALSPSISVAKDAVDGVSTDDDGNLLVTIEGEDGSATVTYRMIVTNTGDDDLANLTLTDDKIGDLTGALTTALVDAFGDATLPAGESVTVFADHEVTADDFDDITLTNVVEVVGTGVDSGASVDDSDNETVTLIQVLDEALPRTGIDALALGVLSLLLALLGAATLLFSRRRDEGTS